MKFVVAHTIAFLLALTSFALFIVSFSTPWFFISTEYSTETTSSTALNAAVRVNLTRTEYDVDGFTTELSLGTNTASTRLQNVDWGNEDVMGSVRHVFYIIETFLIIGILFDVILLLVVIALFFRSVQAKVLLFPQKLFRFILFFLAFMAFVGGFVAFFELRAFPDAIDNDTPNCSAGYCSKLTGADEDKLDTNTIKEVSWGPEAAWYTTLIAFLLSVPLAFIVWLNRIPVITEEEDATGVAL